MKVLLEIEQADGKRKQIIGANNQDDVLTLRDGKHLPDSVIVARIEKTTSHLNGLHESYTDIGQWCEWIKNGTVLHISINGSPQPRKYKAESIRLDYNEYDIHPELTVHFKHAGHRSVS